MMIGINLLGYLCCWVVNNEFDLFNDVLIFFIIIVFVMLVKVFLWFV